VPEILEIEAYRRLAARTIGRQVRSVDAPDAWFLKEGLDADTLASALVGHSVDGVRRIGKLLLVDLHGAPTLGLRFGMTGRLLVDGVAAIDALEYGPARESAAWDRFRLDFDGGGRDGGTMVISDPRRLGGVLLDPDESRLGVDAMTLTPAQLAAVLDRSQAPVKARLMDQARLAGLGNLLTDESLWRGGIDPARPAGSLDAREIDALTVAIRETLQLLGSRGGSHTGDLQRERRRGGVCPRDGAPLARRTVGGRTTYSCPVHQQ
jgi:formamidopyrimidine-DNA glycosylase